MTSRDSYFMNIAQQISTASKDRSRKVGCVIVGADNEILATGYNGFPRGADDNVEARHQRPEKYKWTEHAERNAIYNAARVGARLKNSRAYLSLFPCMDCARALVQAGVTNIFTCEPVLTDPVFGEDFKRSLELFKEVGVLVRYG